MSKTTERVVLRPAGWGPADEVTEEMVAVHAATHPDTAYPTFGGWLMRGGSLGLGYTTYPRIEEATTVVCAVDQMGNYVDIVVEREVEVPDEEPCPSETPPHIGHPWRQQIEFALSSMDSRLSDLERLSKEILSRRDPLEQRVEKTANYVFVSLNPTVDRLVDSIKHLTYHLEAIRSRLSALEQARTVQPWVPYAPTPHWATGPVTCRHATETGGESDE